VNPSYSGKKEAKHVSKQIVEEALKRANILYSLFENQHALHVAEHFKTASLDEVDGILVLGGDGTLNEVINGLMTREDSATIVPPLGQIPAGMGNSMCIWYRWVCRTQRLP
jgi:diacylglycerol kinase family enzyme